MKRPHDFSGVFQRDAANLTLFQLRNALLDDAGGGRKPLLCPAQRETRVLQGHDVKSTGIRVGVKRKLHVARNYLRMRVTVSK